MARSRRPSSRSPQPQRRRFQEERPQPEIEDLFDEEMADAETATGGERSDEEMDWDEESEYSADAAYHERYMDDDLTPYPDSDDDVIQGPRTPILQGPRTPPDTQEFLGSLSPEQRQMWETFEGIGQTPPSYPTVREEGVPEVRTP